MSNILTSLFIALGGIVILMLSWIAIQYLWGRLFFEHISDEDVLSNRTSCGNCGCTQVCKTNSSEVNTNLNTSKTL